jgi:hypothetical protein
MSDSPAAPPRRRAAWGCRPLLGHVACGISLLAMSGCTVLGFVASRVVPAPVVPAQYSGLKDQPIAIMVWAGEGTMIDFPDVRLDVAGSLQKKLEQSREAKVKELKGVSFPTPAASVVRFQESHPELEGAPLTDVAPKLGASRVIYVEIESLQTRSDAAVELYRGSASATVKVLEVADGKAKVAYEESGIAVTFPEKITDAGTPDGNDSVFYAGTVHGLTSEIAKRFVEHPEEQ